MVAADGAPDASELPPSGASETEQAPVTLEQWVQLEATPAEQQTPLGAQKALAQARLDEHELPVENVPAKGEEGVDVELCDTTEGAELDAAGTVLEADLDTEEAVAGAQALMPSTRRTV